MAAEVLAQANVAGAALQVEVYDAMPSVGRKFLLAGKGGLNLTHAEAPKPFMARYGDRQAQLAPLMVDFGAQQLRDWAKGLGIETFVGSTGRVFPKDMKAAPLLRAWLHRLRNTGMAGEKVDKGVQFFMRHRWLGWADGGQLRFASPHGERLVTANAVVLALGGGSWARLGSDGAWVPLLAARGVALAPLKPSNCGFDVPGWTPYFAGKFAGQAFKSVTLSFIDAKGRSFSRMGEFVATATGVEGSLIYAASALLRDSIAANGPATVRLDLLPHKTYEQVLTEVRHPRGSRSLSSHLKSRLTLDGIKAAVLHEFLSKEAINDPVQLAHAIKALPLTLSAARPIDEAISSAGGVRFDALDAHLQLKITDQQLPPVYCAGEMLDWEAPTGGYLLTACFASGQAAARGVLARLGGSVT